MTNTSWEDRQSRDLQVMSALVQAYRAAREAPRAEVAVALEEILLRELGFYLHDNSWLNRVAMDVLRKNPSMSIYQVVRAVSADV